MIFLLVVRLRQKSLQAFLKGPRVTIILVAWSFLPFWQLLTIFNNELFFLT